MSNPKLSTRETEVVQQMVTGRTYAEIAEVLGLSEETVKTYAKRLRKKLGLRSKIQVVVWALKKKGLQNEQVRATAERGRVPGIHKGVHRRAT